MLLRFIIRIKITKAEVERNEDKILDRGVLHFQLAELHNINFHNDWRKLDTVQIRKEVFFHLAVLINTNIPSTKMV